MALLAGLAAVVGATGPRASAATLRVCPSGCPYTSIQPAIDAAHSGDTILIAAGTYRENLTIGSSGPISLTLLGSGVTVDAHQAGRALDVQAGCTVTVSGLTFTGGKAVSGGGIFNVGTLRIDGGAVSGNVAEGPGGGIFNETAGNLRLTGVTLSNNHAGFGGAILNTATMSISGSTFSGNGAGFGGGISNQTGGNLTVSGSLFSGNFGAQGGGVYVGGGSATLNADVLENNSVAYLGGGIQNAGGQLSIGSSNITGNSVVDGDGGGIETAAPTEIRHSVISGNTASRTGGGIFNEAPQPPTLENTIVTDNTPNNCAGTNFSC